MVFDRGKAKAGVVPKKRVSRYEYRKLPPGNVFQVLTGPNGPRLWENLATRYNSKEGTKK